MTNELMERYLYDVVRRLPEKQKKDIEQELRTLLEDMIEERMESTGETEGKCIREVLNELGNPARLARSYRGENDCLISGEYYDSYCFVLKIVLICITAGIVISNIVSAVIHVVEAEGMVDHLWKDMVNIGSLPMALIQVFGVITLIYAIMERNHVKVAAKETAWTLEALPQIPYKKAVISRGDSVVGIVFMLIFASILVFAPQLFGAWLRENGEMVSVPAFNLSIWNVVMPLFLICCLAGIVEEVVKLVAGRYTYTVMTVNIVMNVINMAVSFVLLKIFPIWNKNFLPELEKASGRRITSRGDLLLYFNTDTFSNAILLIILAAGLIDMGVTIYRTVRYEQKQE